MAADWIGTVSTAVVGLAGISSTLWTTNRARKSERELAMNAVTVERDRLQLQLCREEYLAYLRVVESAFDLQNKIRHTYATDEIEQDTYQAADAKLVELIEHVVRLRLCAPELIVDKADNLRKTIAGMFEQTLANGGALLDTYAEAQRALTNVMREDLDRRERAIGMDYSSS
ncbi:hypothetical protein GCM10010399_55440 [Dactylosporangium fulvum]|uniref:Uncharacterized protein n=1 Tax=Dactylosporangium fulvum TaxID=53359 RepID=A0ABY5W1E0_9ACTN|nr:hypothetical protein [Dactylosporangium fulvum]UWP83089.1 hypothetical protein Dfulv_01915 [Dactylosporangium fulvum]